MDEDEEMEQLRAQEARRVREEAKKCLRHASLQLGKAAYEIDEYLKDFSTARIGNLLPSMLTAIAILVNHSCPVAIDSHAYLDKPVLSANLA